MLPDTGPLKILAKKLAKRTRQSKKKRQRKKALFLNLTRVH